MLKGNDAMYDISGPPRSWVGHKRGPKISRNLVLLLAQVPAEAFKVLIQRPFKDTNSISRQILSSASEQVLQSSSWTGYFT